MPAIRATHKSRWRRTAQMYWVGVERGVPIGAAIACAFIPRSAACRIASLSAADLLWQEYDIARVGLRGKRELRGLCRSCQTSADDPEPYGARADWGAACGGEVAIGSGARDRSGCRDILHCVNALNSKNLSLPSRTRVNSASW